MPTFYSPESVCMLSYIAKRAWQLWSRLRTLRRQNSLEDPGGIQSNPTCPLKWRIYLGCGQRKGSKKWDCGTLLLVLSCRGLHARREKGPHILSEVYKKPNRIHHACWAIWWHHLQESPASWLTASKDTEVRVPQPCGSELCQYLEWASRKKYGLLTPWF